MPSGPRAAPAGRATARPRFAAEQRCEWLIQVVRVAFLRQYQPREQLNPGPARPHPYTHCEIVVYGGDGRRILIADRRIELAGRVRFDSDILGGRQAVDGL